MSGDFLSRWSRRKVEARRSERAPARPPEEAAPPEAPAAEAVPAEAELTSEELAQLPKIEELTAETDISVFLRAGVPEPLRNAALRKMWTLDPAIRDFEGHARDYAYDWNLPGGVPGAGPLGPNDDVAALARRVFGESEPEPAAAQSGVEASRDREPAASPEEDRPSVAAARQESDEETPGVIPSRTESAAESPSSEAETSARPAAPFAAPQSETASKPPPDVPSRRHGGAKPV